MSCFTLTGSRFLSFHQKASLFEAFKLLCVAVPSQASFDLVALEETTTSIELIEVISFIFEIHPTSREIPLSRFT
jgi:hypothetical protein